MKINSPITDLDRITATIVYELKEVNLFHYNKLTYIFEYLYIKNFGVRFTNEYFIKLPHGPVIHQYKDQINKLHLKGYIDTDSDKLNEKRKLSDDKTSKVLIKRNDRTEEIIVTNPIVYGFLKKVIIKYANLSVNEIERLVYQTSPVKSYLSKLSMGFKKESGSYLLKDCIKITNYKNEISAGRKKALEHISKYPNVNVDQYKIFNQEFAPLSNLRPAWDC